MLEIGLALVPLLLLLASLLAGHYPGFETIVRLAERMSARLRPLRAVRQPRPKALRTRRTVGGGLLIALGYAQRPPPLAP